MVAPDEAGTRLDRLLAMRLPEHSRSRHKALIQGGYVALKGATIRDPGQRVNAGDTIAVELPRAVESPITPQRIPLDIVYEDDAMLVINKPAGLVVHPAAGNWSGTLVNALIAHCGESLSGIGGEKRPGIVHRLDKNTSGLMLPRPALNRLANVLPRVAMRRRKTSARSCPFRARSCPAVGRPDP